MADGAPVGSGFQSWIVYEKYKFMYVSVLERGTWSWYLCPLELRCLGSSRPVHSGMSVDKTVHDFVLQHHADLV